MSDKNLVAIVGIMDGSAGQVESWFEQASGMRIGCFVIPSDDYTYIDVVTENARRVCQTTAFPADGTFKGHKLVISASWPEKISALGITNVLCLNPNNQKRLEEINLARAANLKLVSAIHPTATILSGAHVAGGVWLNANCTVGYKAEISAGCIINTNASIDHHNVLEECCQIDPGVVTAGNVVIRKCAHVHTGVVIINRMEIGESAIVGAGAVVTKNIPARSTAVGVPAKAIKSFS